MSFDLDSRRGHSGNPCTSPSTPPAHVLAAVGQLLDADYVASAQCLDTSTDARTAIDLLLRLRCVEERLAIAWVGAAVAQMFLRHAWLESIAVEVECKRLDHLMHTLTLFDAVPMPNVRFPDEVGCNGVFDASAAALALQAEHEDHAREFAAPFLWSETEDRITLRLRRTTIEPLLAKAIAVSGLAAARLLWPDHDVVRSIRVKI